MSDWSLLADVAPYVPLPDILGRDAPLPSLIGIGVATACVLFSLGVAALLLKRRQRWYGRTAGMLIALALLTLVAAAFGATARIRHDNAVERARERHQQDADDARRQYSRNRRLPEPYYDPPLPATEPTENAPVQGEETPSTSDAAPSDSPATEVVP